MPDFNFHNRLIIKKSPIIMVKTFIVLQATAVAVFFFAAILADYGEIYKNLPYTNSFSFHVAQAGGILLFETILIFYIFFSWYKEYYEIKQDKIIHAKGIIFRKKDVSSLKTIRAINYRQGPLGRLTKYGDIELVHENYAQITKLENISEPHEYAEFIVTIRGTLGGVKFETFPTIENLILKGEHERLEFKTSFRWDGNQNKVNKNLEKAVMKTIAAFLNSQGGQLLLGVDDKGRAVGLEDDFKSLPKPNQDGFQNHFTNVFHSMIGPEFRRFIEMGFDKIDNADYCLIKVVASDKPAYLKSDDQEEFYIRTGNGTTALRLSKVASYIDSRWRGQLP